MAETLDRETLKALSTETRQEIVKMLSKRPYTASEISKIMNKHVTTITEHLELLEKSGLIMRKDSTNKWVYYALTDKGQKIFKPAYYTWVITLSLALLIVAAFSLYQIFGTGASAGAMMRSGASSISEDQMISIQSEPVFVGIGEVVQEGGNSYIPLEITDRNSQPVNFEINGEVKSGTLPVYISGSSDDISIKIYETKTTDNVKVVPILITKTKPITGAAERAPTDNTTNATDSEKTIRVNIEDSQGNTNSFPVTIKKD